MSSVVLELRGMKPLDSPTSKPGSELGTLQPLGLRGWARGSPIPAHNHVQLLCCIKVPSFGGGTSPSRFYLSRLWTPSLPTADLETYFILSSLRFDGSAEREATAQAVR